MQRQADGIIEMLNALKKIREDLGRDWSIDKNAPESSVRVSAMSKNPPWVSKRTGSTNGGGS